MVCKQTNKWKKFTFVMAMNTDPNKKDKPNKIQPPSPQKPPDPPYKDPTRSPPIKEPPPPSKPDTTPINPPNHPNRVYFELM